MDEAGRRVRCAPHAGDGARTRGMCSSFRLIATADLIAALTARKLPASDGNLENHRRPCPRYPRQRCFHSRANFNDTAHAGCHWLCRGFFIHAECPSTPLTVARSPVAGFARIRPLTANRLHLRQASRSGRPHVDWIPLPANPQTVRDCTKLRNKQCGGLRDDTGGHSQCCLGAW